ncbi:MAG: tRNA uracil 4-sulfurtransferase ThiI [Anaerolineae bacterium]
MALILLRYGEIGLKGQNRTFFLRKLRRNVRQCLKANQLKGEVWQEGQRIYLETDTVGATVEAVQRVFGIVSLSPVQVVAADSQEGEPHPSLDAITKEAVGVALRARLDPSRSFRVRVKRSEKSYPHISPKVEEYVGAAIVDATDASVNLSKEADVEVGIEIQAGRALVFGEVIPGPGGLPLSSQGRVVALLSGGIDSPVAIWLMMKRGCGVIPVNFRTSQAQADKVDVLVQVLNRYAYGWSLRPIVLSHAEVLAPVLARLREVRAERWACIFCKRMMLAKAAEIADEVAASAIVTGDSLGQVASQTLSNLEVISYGIEKPILRPLIGMDKTEIMDLARRIGTYEVSIQAAHTCGFLPDYPLTQARVEKLQELLVSMEGTEGLLPTSGYSSRER